MKRHRGHQRRKLRILLQSACNLFLPTIRVLDLTTGSSSWRVSDEDLCQALRRHHPRSSAGHKPAGSKVQSVDLRMRLGMRCRLSPTPDVPSHTSGAPMCQPATLRAWLGDRQQRRFHLNAARLLSRVFSSTSVYRSGSLLVHAQLAASVQIKSAALPTDAGEKNEPAGGVAESIRSLDDLIQLAEGRTRCRTCQQWWS